ncbi:hypothetical protein FRC11_014073, partial [Ceratobasidium sp. 423]
MKKAWHELTEEFGGIQNIADVCHKLQLVAKDFTLDAKWKEMIQILCEILLFFSQLNHASSCLKECSTKMIFAWARLGAHYGTPHTPRASKNLPAIHLAYQKDMFLSVPKLLEGIFNESDIAAMKFKMSLIKFTSILALIHKALTCLESMNSTIGDSFAYWLATIAKLNTILAVDGSGIDLAKVTILRHRSCFHTHFLKAIDNAPSDVYIAGFLLHPVYCHAQVYHHMHTMSSKAFIRIPAANPLSGSCAVPDAIYKRVRTFALSTLYHLLKDSETDKSHPLNGYDALEAKAACNGQLGDYVHGNYPFHRPLGATESPINWWKSLQHMPEAFPLCLIGEKANSILSNSMPDEWTGSCITFLNSDLRSCTDMMLMVEQIKVMQYYSM